MYRCENCEAEFLEPKVVYDAVPYGEGYVSAPGLECCPFCKGELEEVQICKLCGDTFTESKHADVCPSCIGIVEKRFSEAFKSNFTPLERSIINAVFDGRNLE